MVQARRIIKRRVAVEVRTGVSTGSEKRTLKGKYVMLFMRQALLAPQRHQRENNSGESAY